MYSQPIIDKEFTLFSYKLYFLIFKQPYNHKDFLEKFKLTESYIRSSLKVEYIIIILTNILLTLVTQNDIFNIIEVFYGGLNADFRVT
jgi:hypothetical protein